MKAFFGGLRDSKDGVLVIYEKGLTSSNLNDLLEMLAMKKDQPMSKKVENELEKLEKEAKVEAKAVAKEAKVEEKEAEAGKLELGTTKGQASEPDIQLVLRKFIARNVGAKVATKVTDGEGLRVEIDDFQYNDFHTEMGAGLSIADLRLQMSLFEELV